MKPTHEPSFGCVRYWISAPDWRGKPYGSSGELTSIRKGYVVLVYKPKQALIFKLRNPEKILSVIPTAKRMNSTTVAVPHRPDEVNVLRNLGFSPPDPMPLHYEWSGQYKPFGVQETAATFMAQNRRCFNLSSMGLGKTITTLWAYDYLRGIKQANKMLVISPLSTLERAWGDEIFRNFTHLDFAVLHGSRTKRLELLNSDVDIYIINHHGVKIIEQELAKRKDIDIIAVDELAVFSNSGADMTKAVNRVCNGQYPRRVWGLTGTPIPNSPEEAWSQCRIVVPTNPDVPKYFRQWRDQVMRQITQFKWVAKDGALDTVYKSMQPSVRFALDDAVDLPEQTFEEREVEMTPEQKHMFKEMLNKLVAEYKGGEITAVNEAIKVQKLVQIGIGVAYDGEGNPVVIPSKPRLNELEAVVESAEGKVLVFVPFTSALEGVAEFLSKRWSVDIVQGGTSKHQRDETFKNFQKEKNPHIIVANPGTLQHGLTLTAATNIIWYAPLNSGQTYQQANGRVRRPGQTRTTVITHISTSDVERKMFARLRGKEKMQNVLLDLLKTI